MKKWLALLVCALAFGLVAAGCGGDDDDDGGGSADTAQQTDTAGTDTGQQGAETGEAQEVSIGDNFFEPKDITVPAGTTIKWTNEGEVAHTVTHTAGPGDSFDSGNLDPGSEFEQDFTEPGTIDYVCTIHAGQEGTITVEE